MVEYIEDRTFTQEDIEKEGLAKTSYEHCFFNGCDLTGAKLNNYVFIDCTFTSCNLSNAKVEQTGFRSVQFIESKLTGIDFSLINDMVIDMSFDHCILEYTSFLSLHMKKTTFNECALKSAVFENTDLSGSKFIGCDLERALFLNTNLEKADLASSYNIALDPERNRLKKAIFSLGSCPGLLLKYDLIVQ